MNYQKIDLSEVYRLYPNSLICGVEEFYVPGLAWTSLVDGRHIATNDRSVEEQVDLAIQEGATSIQFKIRDANGKMCYPDYKVKELTA